MPENEATDEITRRDPQIAMDRSTYRTAVSPLGLEPLVSSFSIVLDLLKSTAIDRAADLSFDLQSNCCQRESLRVRLPYRSVRRSIGPAKHLSSPLQHLMLSRPGSS